MSEPALSPPCLTDSEEALEEWLKACPITRLGQTAKWEIQRIVEREASYDY